MPKDLDTIVLQCLRKDADDRYGTAEVLAQDLRSFVKGDPIEARPQGRWKRLRRRIVRRRRLIVMRTLVFGLLLVCGAFIYETLQTEPRKGRFENAVVVTEI